jgi:hypothetical protein
MNDSLGMKCEYYMFITLKKAVCYSLSYSGNTAMFFSWRFVKTMMIIYPGNYYDLEF